MYINSRRFGPRSVIDLFPTSVGVDRYLLFYFLEINRNGRTGVTRTTARTGDGPNHLSPNRSVTRKTRRGAIVGATNRRAGRNQHAINIGLGLIGIKLSIRMKHRRNGAGQVPRSTSMKILETRMFRMVENRLENTGGDTKKREVTTATNTMTQDRQDIFAIDTRRAEMKVTVRKFIDTRISTRDQRGGSARKISADRVGTRSKTRLDGRLR